MVTIFQKHKSSIGLVFSAEKDLNYFVFIANAAQFRAWLAAQPNAFVATFKFLLARFVARRSIAQLVAQVFAFYVLTLPFAFLQTRRALLIAFLLANGMNASVLAFGLARLALLGARVLA
jgi:hypothetical protein